MKTQLGINIRAFTILELVVSLSIGLIVMAALTATFIKQRGRYKTQGQLTEMTQQAVVAMDILFNEVVMAGYNPTGGLQSSDPDTPDTFVGIDPVSATHFMIYSDLNEDGETNGAVSADDDSEVVEYIYDSDGMVLKRGADGGETVGFADNVQAFSASYLDIGGNPTADAGAIRRMKIAITFRTGEPDVAYSGNGGYKTMTLSSDVCLRNLGRVN